MSINLVQTLKFTEKNKSKRILLGQSSGDLNHKYVFSMFVTTLILLTFGAFFIVLLLVKKKQFHPDIYISGTDNPIDGSKAKELVQHAGYSLDASDDPFLLINLNSNDFILFTQNSIFYELKKSNKFVELNNTVGKLPITAARDIKTKRNIMNGGVSISMNEEDIGALEYGADRRVTGILEELSKDVRTSLD
jgi:hypothetical protein